MQEKSAGNFPHLTNMNFIIYLSVYSVLTRTRRTLLPLITIPSTEEAVSLGV